MRDLRDLLPGERVLWQGRPDWRALARDMLHIRAVAFYLAAALIWHAAQDRMDGYGPVDTLLGCAPLFVFGLIALGICAALAWFSARSTTYVVTTERCVMRFGIALDATLSLPWRRIAGLSVALRSDGTGDIPLALKPAGPGTGRKLGYLKLWPYARPWRFARPQPMLRSVPDAARLAQMMALAAADVAPGRVGALPGAPVPDLVPADALIQAGD